MRGKGNYFLCMLMTALIAFSLCGCGNGDAAQITEIEKLPEDTASDERIEESGEKETQSDSIQAEADGVLDQTQAEGNAVQAGEEAYLDQIDPDPADDNWYMKGSVYKNDSGHYVEVFFDDEGMLEFAVDGLSLYYSSVDKVQYENDWRIYECEDGITVVYYPGDPAHLEIYGGDYEGLYEEDGDKTK